MKSHSLVLLIGVLLTLFVVLNLNDYFLTLLALRLGVTEGNPIATVGVKVLSVLVVIGTVNTLFVMYRRRLAVPLLIATACLFYASILLWNLWVVSLL